MEGLSVIWLMSIAIVSRCFESTDFSDLYLARGDSDPAESLNSFLEKFREQWNKIGKTSDRKNLFYEWMYKGILKQFDVDGYNNIIRTSLSPERQFRFVTALSEMKYKLPHCDYESVPSKPSAIEESKAPFPGGPLRSASGGGLTEWVTNQLMSVANNAGGGNPAVKMMAQMSLTSLVGIISTVASTAIDVIPPLIPPPIWIFRPLPCLPMLTGFNCLLSVLYPITIADFTIAHVTDQIMNGVLNSFPGIFRAKVGEASSTVYDICSTVYLGLHCASLFPMCWLPIGLMEAQTFGVCLPQCLLVLVSCPGFWLDDIGGPCSSVSIPPFCSFSLFVNKKAIPPPYTTYSDQHPYPSECPKFDPDFDINTSDLYKPVAQLESPILKEGEAAKLSLTKMRPVKSLIGSIDSYSNVIEPIERVLDCSKVSLSGCELSDGNLGNVLNPNALSIYAKCCRRHKREDKTGKKSTLKIIFNRRKDVGKRGHTIPVSR